MHGAQIFELILALLAIVIGLYWLALKLRFPPSAALMVGGGALAFLPGIPAVSLDPELALVLFLPPLLIDGAYSTAMGRFRQQLTGILSLAVGAQVIAEFIETEQHATVMQGLGVGFVQGWHLGRPGPIRPAEVAAARREGARESWG